LQLLFVCCVKTVQFNKFVTCAERDGKVKFKFKTSQARSIYHYKKLEIKVLKYNADIFFNKEFLAKKKHQCKPWDPIGLANECALINTIFSKPDDGLTRPKHVA